MRRKLLKKAGIFAAALATAILLIGMFERFLDRKIEEMYDVSAYTKTINMQYEDFTKDKGQVILRRSADNGNVILMGSSELGSWVEQNPIRMFPNTTLSDNLTIVGQAYVQNLLHAMKAGTDALADVKKLGIVVSLQWFFGDDIDVNGFASNFSEYQFYNMMRNENVSAASKRYVCQRTSELLREVEGYDDVKVYAWLKAKDSAGRKACLMALAPYYSLREKALEIRDKWETYRLLQKTAADAEEPKVRELDWEAELKKAEGQGKSSCTNNDFYVEDSYYSAYLAPEIDGLEGVEAGEMLASREMQDYEMFLQICKENGIEPYVIIMNTNGKYYDYVGIDKERRNRLYDEIEQRADAQGVKSLRLSEKEYEPYFMVDVMHLGWKGWLYVDRQIAELYAENQD